MPYLIADDRGLALLAKRAERRSDLGREQLRLLPRGEVTAPGGVVVIDEGWVLLLHPAARGAEDLAGEDREADRKRDRWRRLAGRKCLGAGGLPVQAGGRGPGAGQPVQRDVVEDVVPGQTARGPPPGEGAGDLVVGVGVWVEHPARQGDGGIQQGVADGLRPRGLLKEVGEASLPFRGERLGRRAFLLGVRR